MVPSSNVPFKIRDDDRFIATPLEFAVWADGKKELRMEFFYREMRKRTAILMDGDKPAGGAWNLDKQNRKAMPKRLRPPSHRFVAPNSVTRQAIADVARLFPSHFGSLEGFGYATTPKPLTLGSASWYGGGFTAGRIDQPAAYTRALLPDEIRAMAGVGLPVFDQRGLPRTAGAAADIGAFELEPYVVTNTNDSGPGSLRQAVADDSFGDEPIVFSPALSGRTITLTSGPIEIGHNLTISGPGASLLTLDGGNQLWGDQWTIPRPAYFQV